MKLTFTSEANHLKHLVEQGGGVWVGVQESVSDDGALVLFNSPFHKSTLAVPVRLMSAEAVALKITESNKTFSKPSAAQSVHPDYLVISKPNAAMFATKLRELATLFEQLTQEKK